MHASWVRRFGWIAAVAVLLGLYLVPAASASTIPSTGTACAPVIHVVCRGETLYRIAARYGVSVQAIVAANGIWNPNAIYAGQRLVIPGCGSWSPPPPPPPACYTCPPPPAGCSVHYTVHPGDTLTRIAYRYGTTISNLMRCNAIANPNRIYAGQSLCICGGIGPVFPPGPPGP